MKRRYFFFQIDVKEITIISQFTEKIPPISWILMKTDATIVASEKAFFVYNKILSLPLSSSSLSLWNIMYKILNKQLTSLLWTWQGHYKAKVLYCHWLIARLHAREGDKPVQHQFTVQQVNHTNTVLFTVYITQKMTKWLPVIPTLCMNWRCDQEPGICSP